MSGPAGPGRTTGGCAALACLWEATAPKPGNVYRGADFADMTYADFVTAAAVVGPVFDHAQDLALGELILAAVRAMRGAVGVNTHLGTILLLAPLAKAGRDPSDLLGRAGRLAAASTIADAEAAYQAIRLAAPGGLGSADQADVSQRPTVPLAEAMTLAAERDLIARQWRDGFPDVAQTADHIAGGLAGGLSLSDAIVAAHVGMMSRRPDTLIARKLGGEAAAESAARAGRVLESGPAGSAEWSAALADLDFWLRADGHRRNPGATADVVCAALYCLLAQDRLPWPVSFYQPPPPAPPQP